MQDLKTKLSHLVGIGGAKYRQLPFGSSSESEAAVGEAAEEKVSASYTHRASPLWRVLPWVVHALFFSISLMFLISAQRTLSRELGPPLVREYSKALDECGTKKPVLLEGEFGAPSRFRGQPNAEVDAAWEGLEQIPETEISRLGKLRNSSVRAPDGGYLTSLGAFHRIHCLDILRKHSYLDYYVVKEKDFFTAPTLRTHLDHCIEMLRQILMCDADLHLITYDWVAEVDYPWPDFSTNQYCRDYQSVHDWVGEHKIYADNVKDGVLPKPADAVFRKLPDYYEAHGPSPHGHHVV